MLGSFTDMLPFLRIVALCAGVLFAWSMSMTTSLAGAKPNIVLFVVDDMGWQDTSVPFWTQTTALNNRYRTPNMEQLAQEGVKFTSAHAHAICSPTRVSIMTGQNPARSRVTFWTKDRDVIPGGGNGGGLLAPTDWNYNSLQPIGTNINNTIEAPSLPSLLQAEGYRTMHVGKAHLGSHGTPGGDPTTLGFDDNVAGWGAGGPGSFLGTQNFGNQFGQHTLPWGVPDLEEYHGQNIFLSEALTLEANNLIDDAVDNDQPFFLHMSHYAVHVPLATDTRFDQNYPGLSGAQLQYATMVEGMDKSLGDIMQKLEDRGVADNTIIVFTSDNGVLNTAGVPGNPPLRGGKGTAYEGGLRVPMIVKAPGIAAPQTTNDTNVRAEDLYPTLLALGGAEIPANYIAKVDGEDFTPLLTGQGTFEADRPLFFHQPHTHLGAQYSAVIEENWKLVFWHRTGDIDLFDLASDIGESNDLSGTMPVKAQQLSNELVQYLTDVDAQMPTVAATGQLVSLPAIVGLLGDLNGDSEIDVSDWHLFRGGLGTTITAITADEAAQQGDFNFNLVVDKSDFVTFKSVYNEVNGAGSFASAVAVPEPSTIAGVAITQAGLIFLLARMRKERDAEENRDQFVRREENR
ncbi:MAG: sulfatase-like hydrolase/transferase [Aeoliella sp.]